MLFGQIRLPAEARAQVAAAAHAADAPSEDQARAHWERQIRRVQEGFVAELLDRETAARLKQEAERALARLALAPTTGDLTAGYHLLTDLREAWPRMTQGERQAAIRVVLQAVGLDVRARAIACAPHAQFAPLFEAVAESAGGVQICVWRPRADSNRRSPP